MYRIFLFFFLISPNVLAQFTENWDDNSFVTPPVWQGHLDKYNINTAQQKLLLNAPPETSEASISTPSKAIDDATWEFTVYLDFNPSSSNYAKIFLSGSQANYNDNMEGYYVMVGNTEDEVSLWKRAAGNNVKIIDGTDKILDTSPVEITIRVQRDNIGNWQLQTKLPGQSYVTEGGVLDNTLPSAEYFGIYCRYTSTRSDKFSFGPVAVSGDPFVDSSKPRILSHELIAGHQFDILLSKTPEPTSVSTANFTLEPGAIHPQRYTLANSTVNIYFDDYLRDTNFGQLSIYGIEDEWGNVMNDTTITYGFKRIKLLNTKVAGSNSLELTFNKPLDASVTNLHVAGSELNFGIPILVDDTTLLFTSTNTMLPHRAYAVKLSGIPAAFGDIIKDSTVSIIYRPAERFDIVFTELMPDPTPNVGLFGSEYIEIYNRRDYPINISGMHLAINGKESVLPNYELLPNTYTVIINQNNLPDWPNNVPVLGIKSLPALTNSEGTLILYHSGNTVSDVIQYPLGIEEGGFKADGGWSFERMDPNNHQPDNNWAYSVNLDGGTPGTENSVNTQNSDTIAPYVKYISFVNPSTFKIIFSEALGGNESIEPSSIQVEGADVSGVSVEPIFFNSLQISFAEGLPTGQVFKASFTSTITDFAGNALGDSDTSQIHSLRLGVPEAMDSFDVCVNEVLFNPGPEDVDFVEIYNRSNKILNRNDIFLSSLVDAASDVLVLDELKQIDQKNRLFFPGDLMVVTSDAKKTVANHDSIRAELLNQSTLPSMSDDEGSIAIAKNNGQLIDYFVYSDKMHFELLRNKEGVSLERISPNGTTNNPHNWHSASRQSGYASPTRQNSQYSDFLPREDVGWLTLEKEEFSPDADGNDDFLQINYKLGEPGWTGSVTIYNRYGNPVKTIANNELLGTEGFFIWDGTTDHHQKAAMGIYLVYADIFSTSGKRKQQKVTAVLTAGVKR